MNWFLTYAYLFFLGSLFGWVLELFFRRFFSKANPEHKWINPGFCQGPYLPLYGSGLCILYLFASLPIENISWLNGIVGKLLTVICMSVSMTAVEYVAGAYSLHRTKVRLWDYSDEWGNIDGIICPKFSFYWAVIAAIYYFLIHPYILGALNWLSRNLAFSFVIGLFFGIFLIDVSYSTKLISKVKKFAVENNVVVRYENLKAHIRSAEDKAKEKTHFLFSLASSRSLSEHLHEAEEALEKRIHRTVNKYRGKQ